MTSHQNRGGNAVPDMTGVPIPKVARPTTPSRTTPENRGWARRPSSDEFPRELLERHGYKVTGGKAKPGPKPKTYDEAAVVREYVAGDGAPTVAARHGITDKTVLGAVRRAGKTVRGPGGHK